MNEDRQLNDPYAPPPRLKDKSGPALRVALLAAMLGLGFWGYTQFANTPSQPLVAEQVEEQQVADAGYEVIPETLPAGAPSASDEAPASPTESVTTDPAATPAAPSTPTTP